MKPKLAMSTEGVGRGGGDGLVSYQLLMRSPKLLKPTFPMLEGGGSGRVSSQLFNAESKTAQRPNSPCPLGGGRVLSQRLIPSPKLPKIQIPHVNLWKKR